MYDSARIVKQLPDVTAPIYGAFPRAFGRLMLCAAVVGLVACGKPAERPSHFELPLPGGGLLRIPDKRPNQYQWTGNATMDRKTGIVSSSNLAFRWKSGVAAGGMGSNGPAPVDDLVLFHFQIGEGLKPSGAFTRETFPVSPSGELAPPPHHRAVLFTGASTVDPWAYYYLRDSDASVISCMTGKPAKGGHGWCTGTMFLDRTIKIEYSFMRHGLAEVDEIQLAVKNLIMSWKVE